MKRLRNATLFACLIALFSANSTLAQQRFTNRGLPQDFRKAVQQTQQKKSTSNPQKKNGSNRFGTGTITPTGGLPDLAITLLKRQGSQNIQVTVVNVGDQRSAICQATIKVYRLSDRQEIARKTMSMPGLVKRQATTLTFTGLPLKDVRVLALVDSSGSLQEKDERNNSKTRILDSRRPPAVADLVVDRISRNRDGLMVIVANRGNSNASPTELLVGVRRKSDGQIIFRKQVWVTGLGEGHHANVQVTGSELSNLSNTDVFATADNSRKMTESNENNNTKHVSFGP